MTSICRSQPRERGAWSLGACTLPRGSRHSAESRHPVLGQSTLFSSRRAFSGEGLSELTASLENLVKEELQSGAGSQLRVP